MKKVLTAKVGKLTAWVMFLSITGLALTSILPWISFTETTPVEEELFFNLEMMKKSYNEDVVDLSEKINLIDTSFFLVLIFSILSYLSLTIYRSQKYSSFSQSMMIIEGCAIVILSAFIIFLNFNFIKTVEDIEGISASYIFLSIKYIHILLILCVGLLISSVSYTGIVVIYSVRCLRDTTKQKTSEQEELSKKNPEKYEENITKNQLLKEELNLRKKPADNLTSESTEIEDWLKDELESIERPTRNIKEQMEKEEEETNEETKEKEEDEGLIIEADAEAIEKALKKHAEEDLQIEKEEPKTTDEEEKIKEETSQELEKENLPLKKPMVEPFKSEEKKIETEISEDTTDDYNSFEKVLSSAIEKKQKEIKKADVNDQENETSEAIERRDTQEEDSEEIEKTDTSDVETKEDKSSELNYETKIFTVRCPECKNVFTVKKTGEVTDIKCPRCGKEGIIR